MTDFNSDLNTEKLGEIESAIRELEAEISDAKGDIDRLETIEFFDRGEESRQAIVHWLEDGDDIEDLEAAKTFFVNYSESIANDNTKKQVSHGDVLVAGGDCPWYAFCAKVDVGLVGGDAGFQEPDPLGVAGTELEDNRPYKEFIVWGGCGNEGGDPGGGDCPPSTAVSVPTLCASSSSGTGPITIQAIADTDPTDNDPTEYPLFKLKELSVAASSEPEPEEGDTKFLAFNENAVKNCDTGCTGLFVDLKKFAAKKTNHSFQTQVSLFTLTSTPIEATPTTIELTTSTLTLTPGSASINSDPCGQLTVSLEGGGGSGGACGGSISALQLSNITPGTDTKLVNDITITEEGMETVSLGASKLVSDLVEIPLGNSASDEKTVFLPIIPDNECPVDDVIDFVDDVQVSIEEDNTACGGTGEQCKTIKVTVTPQIGKLTFRCGVLVNIDPPTMGVKESIAEFKVPCGCDPEPPCNPPLPVASVTVNFRSDPNNTRVVGINESYVLTPFNCMYFNGENGSNMSIQHMNGVWTATGSGGTSSWSIKGTGNSPNTIPSVTVSSGIAGDFIIVTYS
jgi:hypothetical protein